MTVVEFFLLSDSGLCLHSGSRCLFFHFVMGHGQAQEFHFEILNPAPSKFIKQVQIYFMNSMSNFHLVYSFKTFLKFLDLQKNDFEISNQYAVKIGQSEFRNSLFDHW